MVDRLGWCLLAGWLVVTGCSAPVLPAPAPPAAPAAVAPAPRDVMVELTPLPYPTMFDEGIGVVRVPVEEFLTAIRTDSATAVLESEIREQQAAGQAVISLAPGRWRAFFSTAVGCTLLQMTQYRIYCPKCAFEYRPETLAGDTWHYDYLADPRGHRLFRYYSDMVH